MFSNLHFTVRCMNDGGLRIIYTYQSFSKQLKNCHGVLLSTSFFSWGVLLLLGCPATPFDWQLGFSLTYLIITREHVITSCMMYLSVHGMINCVHEILHNWSQCILFTFFRWSREIQRWADLPETPINARCKHGIIWIRYNIWVCYSFPMIFDYCFFQEYMVETKQGRNLYTHPTAQIIC